MLLSFQTHRELVKLAEGTGFRIHMIHKASEAAKKFGPKSSKKFGNFSPLKCFLKISEMSLTLLFWLVLVLWRLLTPLKFMQSIAQH